MKTPPSILVLLGLPAQEVLAAFRPNTKGGAEFAEDATEVDMRSSPGSDCTVHFNCTEDNKKITFSNDGKFVGCCLPGQHLSGSEQSTFDCCGRGHELAGDARVGYTCCPTGFDENDRRYGHEHGEDYTLGSGGGVRGRCGIKKTCANGKTLVNHECVCPRGEVEGSDGCCRPCTSGIETGKCYTFKYDNGFLLGWNILNYYGPGPESRNQRSGLFKLCKTEKCTPGLPISPADGIRIKDLHGLPNTGANPGEWLNNASNGAHITKTPDYTQAGVFTLTKWPCGKYCLGGLDAGVGPTCPAEVVGSTFTTFDKNSCTPIELMEVPCDSHARENDCIWKNGDQCCDKVDCGTKH